MIILYCRKNHDQPLCVACNQILEYALQRLDNCVYGNAKPVCSKCPVHCYKPDKREMIRRIMRYSGPRMVLYHPIFALMHVYRRMNL